MAQNLHCSALLEEKSSAARTLLDESVLDECTLPEKEKHGGLFSQCSAVEVKDPPLEPVSNPSTEDTEIKSISGSCPSSALISAASQFAYVTLVMKRDGYVPGALVVGYSLRLTGTKAQLVCMVTHDVSAAAHHRLTLIFDHVPEVPYLQFECKRLRTAQQCRLYKQWVEMSFTKWNALSLTQYEKVLFVDADQVVFKNIDHLFELSAPAGTFSSPWAVSYADRRGRVGPFGSKASANDKSRSVITGTLNPYFTLKHGDIVPPSAICQGFCEESFVCIGAMVLLSPSLADFEDYQTMCEDWVPFGFENCHSMMDEQSICWYYYERAVAWTHIHPVYNFIPWHPH